MVFICIDIYVYKVKLDSGGNICSGLRKMLLEYVIVENETNVGRCMDCMDVLFSVEKDNINYYINIFQFNKSD